MANSTLTNLFVDIADAIREKSDTSESIPALEFPDRIREISGGGGGTGGEKQFQTIVGVYKLREIVADSALRFTTYVKEENT